MPKMFKQAYFFDHDLSSWDVSKVREMDEMFEGALDFTGNLSKWNVGSKLRSWRYMFKNLYENNVTPPDMLFKLDGFNVKDLGYVSDDEL